VDKVTYNTNIILSYSNLYLNPLKFYLVLKKKLPR
jgi:hypothetical protein